MNVKRFIIATIVVFIYIFLFEWFFHGVLMRDMYLATATMWRTQTEMQAHFGWLILGQFIMALMFCYIFTKGYQAKGMLEGIRYGFYITLLLTSPQLMMYAVQPIPADMALYWALGGLVELVIAGALVSLIYKK